MVRPPRPCGEGTRDPLKAGGPRRPRSAGAGTGLALAHEGRLLGRGDAEAAVHAVLLVVHLDLPALAGQAAVDDKSDAFHLVAFVAFLWFVQNQLPRGPGSAAAGQGHPYRRIQTAGGKVFPHCLGRAGRYIQHTVYPFFLALEAASGQGRRPAHLEPAYLPKPHQLHGYLASHLHQDRVHEHLQAIHLLPAVAVCPGRIGHSLCPAAAGSAAAHRLQGQLASPVLEPLLRARFDDYVHELLRVKLLVISVGLFKEQVACRSGLLRYWTMISRGCLLGLAKGPPERR